MADTIRGTVNRRALLAATTLGVVAPSLIRAQPRNAATPHSSREALERALARIADPNGEGGRACLTVYTEAARAAADAADARARTGIILGPLDGAIVSIKDLFDVAGEPTRAGSTILANAPPAKADAVVVRRLRSAGAVIVAKTNMVEFAFGGGLNPHYGTPGNPADRARIPGGSSSGAAVAAADGMCEIAIGSDTAGSVRMPAALCGVVGFKPSKFRVPTDGVFPLSYTCDSIGPLARTVADCAAADAVMANQPAWTVEPEPLAGLRLSVPQGLPLLGLDQTVATHFDDAIRQLARAGTRLSEERIALFDDMVRINGPFNLFFSAVEGYAIHRAMLAARAADYDPKIRARLEAARGVSAADYIANMRERDRLIGTMDARLRDLDGLVLPTVPIVAPRMTELSQGDDERRLGPLLIRNTAIANFFDLCAISVPLPRQGSLPVGLMLVARNGEDRKLFRMALAVERLFAS